MTRKFLLPLFSILLYSCSTLMAADNSILIFRDSGFPAADSAPAPDSLLKNAIFGTHFASANELKDRLNSANLLVLPYGSAFPEEAWGEIENYLQRGGNLLVLGGRPFSRAAYREGGSWKLRDYSVRYMLPLRIDQYQETPGSDGLKFESNPDIPLAIPQFAWKPGFSPIIHLSAVDLYQRGGSAGSIDSNLDPLAWAMKDGRRMSAPVIQIDHFRNGFDGGRWIFVDAGLTQDFYTSAAAHEMISKLAEQAARGAEEFTVRPVLPLYLPGEPIEFEVRLWSKRLDPAYQYACADPGITPSEPGRCVPHGIPGIQLTINFYSAERPEDRTNYGASLYPFPNPIRLDAPRGKGLYIVEATLSGGFHAKYHSAFWIRDLDYLRSGPKLSVNENYFELDGKPLAVIGTTYMSSEVQRLYFDHPNVYVWDQDLKQIHDAGLNMVRTGWWTGWDKFCDETGVPYERTLRTLEAYLMTARKYDLPVQFNFFAFLPEVLGGVNPYLDPEAVRKQKTLISSVVARFHDVPYLAYDLINEPSISKHLWTMRPNGDWIETQKWNDWLNKHYSNREALAAAWNVPITSVQGQISLPDDIDFQPRGMYNGHNSLKIYDYQIFAQESFADWVKTMRDAIRGTGSQQLITVGQDEGGFQDRPSPAFFGQYVDFTTNHSWWQNDSILWDSLVAKQPGKAMLIQETGLQRELNLDETARRTPENEAALFERKVAMSFVHGSGAIEWLWNTNSYMTEGNETSIGALRADGTEKPEATVMRNFAKFAAELGPHLRNPEPAQVAIIASQAAQYSAISDLQIEAQRKAARALAYYARLTPYLIYENQTDEMGNPKLAILPSAQAFTESAWQKLLNYVKSGGYLVVTGPIDRNEHGQRVDRAAQFFPGSTAEPLTFHHAVQEGHGADEKSWSDITFDQNAQSWLEYLRFVDGSTFKDFTLGKGRVWWTSYPLELSAGQELCNGNYPSIYDFMGGHASLSPKFHLNSALSLGVMAYPLDLEDSVLYIFASDDPKDSPVDIRDSETGVELKFTLPAEHAALALIGKKEKAVIAKYGF